MMKILDKQTKVLIMTVDDDGNIVYYKDGIQVPIEVIHASGNSLKMRRVW
jgi:uncharacterized protein YkvS